MLLLPSWVPWDSFSESVLAASPKFEAFMLCTHTYVYRKNALSFVERFTSFSTGHRNVSSETWLFTFPIKVFFGLLTLYILSCRKIVITVAVLTLLLALSFLLADITEK